MAIVAAWTVTAVLLTLLVLGTVGNLVSRSPAERAVMTAASAVLAPGVLLVALD